MFHPDDQARAWEVWRGCLATGAPYHIEYRLRHHSGVYRWVLGRAQAVRDENGTITRWFGTCTDIQDIVDAREVLARSRHELEQAVEERTGQLMIAEERLRQAHKMEAVGQLTGGIAHDFNNMLAVIIGSLDMLERRIAQGATDLDRYIVAAKDGATRAAALTQRLLGFARQQPLAPVALDINALVSGMIDLLMRTLGEKVTVETRLQSQLATALADPNLLENVILNLSVNARDAMPDGGRLTIETANETLDAAAAGELGLAPGDYVALTVADTGSGMSDEVAARAFDPFFTTKGVGKGTGLGLSQVFGFARQSGGHVAIDTAPGRGTRVTLLLPRHDAPPAANDSATEAGGSAPGRPMR
ncbi:ATP-binding protein [Sphingomonas sp. J344]|uniref:PAS domain-containing hybrid sensor histidine kinase/response regulator n=1 Tax=Sphingomonas sp. J344 TaxID=2898434 RepID=UPI002151B39D|nr:PAS domain-containing hybrid sensor histidine kinase/response regulator [Sphingomonas sp. J344]MCR5870805.1 ATP-binding protein [Sphingomonas sp. J344]